MSESDRNNPSISGHRAALARPDKLEELKEANKRLKRKIFDLYTIFELSKHLNSVLNTDALLDGIILTCIGQMGVNGAAVFIVKDHLSENLALAKWKGLNLEPSSDCVIPVSSPVLQLFQTLHTRPLSFAEIREKVGDGSEVQLLKKLECEYLIPMSLQNRVRGLLSVTRKISGSDFFEDDLEFLAILANQLSVAVENARLFDSEKEALQKLRTTQEQLVQTEKLAALGQLSARLAHEVNNPLGIIKNYLLMASDQSASRQEAGAFLQIVTEEVDRIAGIVRQLLSLFRPQKEEFSEVDLEEILDETLLLLSIELQKNKIAVVKNISNSLPIINGSRAQLKQVFLNLLINACDFMPDGGKIAIESEVAGGRLKLGFADSGPGIAPENLTKVFEPFFTTKTHGRGTGLGLSVCYGIIKSHGGEIRVTNTEGAGARFIVELPVGGANAGT